MKNDGVFLTIFLCCGWPLLVHIAFTFGWRFLITHDWKNIQWQNLRFPWSKDE